MIPLGLKETKELDLLVPLKVSIGVFARSMRCKTMEGSNRALQVWLGAVQEMLQLKNVFFFGTVGKKKKIYEEDLDLKHGTSGR